MNFRSLDPRAAEKACRAQATRTPALSTIPEDLSDQEKIAARLARELSTRHRVGDELYHEAEQAFGCRGQWQWGST